MVENLSGNKLAAYSSNDKYLRDEFSALRMYFVNYLKYISLGLDGDNFCELGDNFRKNFLERFGKVRLNINSRLKKTSSKVLISVDYLKEVYKFSELDWFCVLVGIAKKLNIFDKKLVDLENFEFNYEFVVKFFHFQRSVVDVPNFYNEFESLSHKMDKFCFNTGFEIDTNLCNFIMSDGKSSSKLNNVEIFYPNVDNLDKLDIHEDISHKFSEFLSKNSKENCYFHLYGSKGIGKKSIVVRAANLAKSSLVMLKLDKNIISGENKFYKTLISSLREAYLLGAVFCVSNLEFLYYPEHERKIGILLNLLRNYVSKVFVLSNINDFEKKKSCNTNNLIKYDENFEFFHQRILDLKKNESIKLWEKFLRKLDTFEDEIISRVSCQMANRFRFSILQIKNTVKALKNLRKWDPKFKLNQKTLSDCAYLQLSADFSGKAVQIDTSQTWDDLVIGKSEKTMLLNACAQIKFRHMVYEKWNFAEKIPYGNGLSMLFSGPPGTGKTMAASVVANELGLKLYRVNLSAIVSKYIGETEKNLDEIFDLAQRGNIILFFDETDAIFGKRTEVKDSHDKNANIEVSYLLQKMEEFDGVTVMTTNFQNNIDAAFFRRISYVIHFNLPSAEFRYRIWKKIFPKEVPLSQDIDFDFLAKNFEISGGNIKNIALVSAFMAASENSKELKFSHILKAVKYELKKQGSTVLNHEFGQYAYLLPEN